MGNCISKINKDHFFAFEEKMKNDILFFKGKTTCMIEMCARGKKYTGIHSIKKYSKTFAPLQTGTWCRNLFYLFCGWTASFLALLRQGGGRCSTCQFQGL